VRASQLVLGMRKGWFSRCQVSTVGNLADVLVRCTGLLRPEEGRASYRNVGKVSNSQKLVDSTPPLSYVRHD